MIGDDEIHKIAAVEMEHWWYRGMREICFSLLAPYVNGPEPLRILDIGCGTGANLAELAALGPASGIDISPLCLDYCTRKGLNCTLGSMSELHVPPASFDLMTMFDVLTQAEPEENIGILTSIAEGLAVGGLLAFRESAMRIAGGAHDRAVGIRQRFTKREIVTLLTRTGLEPLRVTYVNTLLFVPIVLVRRLQDAVLPDRAVSDVRLTPRFMNAALLSTLRVERHLLRVTDLPFGVSVFAVARKRNSPGR